MGLAFRFLLEQSGYDVIGNDLPGKGAEVEGDLSNIRERGRVVREVIHKSNGKLDGMIALKNQFSIVSLSLSKAIRN